MLVARPLRRVRVWSRHAENAAHFAAVESERHGIKIEVAPDARAAVAGADLICTTTSATAPILAGDWIAPGAHINAVGSSVASARELDTAAVVRSRLFVDRRESALNEAGDFLIPKQQGVLGDEHIAGELGEVLLGALPGRRAPEEITLFKSLGLAIEDLAAAQHIYDHARQRGIGTWLPFGGSR